VRLTTQKTALKNVPPLAGCEPHWRTRGRRRRGDSLPLCLSPSAWNAEGGSATGQGWREPVSATPAAFRAEGDHTLGAEMSLASSAGPAQRSGVAEAVGDAGAKLASLTEPGKASTLSCCFVHHLLQPRLAGEAEGSADSWSPPDSAHKCCERRGRVDWNREVQARGEVDACPL
jgi:hypothetical protein